MTERKVRILKDIVLGFYFEFNEILHKEKETHIRLLTQNYSSVDVRYKIVSLLIYIIFPQALSSNL